MKRTELLLLCEIIRDVGLMCSTSVSRDITYVKSRFKSEGLQFITITLPLFAKAIERCLEQERFDPSLFRAYRKVHPSKGLIPAFLSGITSKIFEVDGSLRSNASVEAIDGVRQICLAFNKTKKECTDDRKRNAINAYRDCEVDISQFRIHKYSALRDFDRVVRCAFGRVFLAAEWKLRGQDLTPKHGPGAVVDRLRGNGKYRSLTWTRRLERYMKLDSYLFCNAEEAIEGFHGVKLLDPKDEPPVKVIFVPKTQKTPRVIAIEPTWNQYAQQAIMRELVASIEADSLLRKSIHFSDSSINGDLARTSSVHRRLATLDMSEASDRVHASLVHRMLRDYPVLSGATFSSRSKCAKLPTGEVIHLKKFASMGSALCFPFEAMVFYTLAIIGILKSRNLSVNIRNISLISRDLHVFGDDLVIPSDTVSQVISELESVRLKVNRSKTFVQGNFRESCGVDAYKGYLVTPVYVRTELPKTRQDTTEILSLTATSNLFYKKGYWRTAKYIREDILDRIDPLPHVLENSPALGYYSYLGTYSVGRWNSTLHRFELKGLVPQVKKSSDPLYEYRRLLKFFITRGFEPTDIDDYDRSTRRGSVYTKSRWITPY